MQHKYMTGRPKYHVKGTFLVFENKEYYQIGIQGTPLPLSEPEKLKKQNISLNEISGVETLEVDSTFLWNQNANNLQMDDNINELLYFLDDNADHISSIFENG